EEIKEAVWGCASSKAAGPDGFNFKFIKTFWDLIKAEFLECIKYFESTGRLANGCNPSFIVLIPKRNDPLARVIASVISPNQAAFISSRQMLDGILVANEANGVRPVMEKLDLLVPFVSLDIRIFLANSGADLSLLQYADDALFFGEWSRTNALNLIHILWCFELASGLKVNIDKSRVIGVGVPVDEVVSLAASLGCSHEVLPFFYLGLPWRFLVEKMLYGVMLLRIFMARMEDLTLRLVLPDTRFWLDPWCNGGVRLSDAFPRLYALEQYKACKIADRWHLINNVWVVIGHGVSPPRGRTNDELSAMTNFIDNLVRSSNGLDRWEWNCDHSGLFKTKTLCKYIQEAAQKKEKPKTIYKPKLYTSKNVKWTLSPAAPVYITRLASSRDPSLRNPLNGREQVIIHNPSNLNLLHFVSPFPNTPYCTTKDSVQNLLYPWTST
nr:hypothetical protein [Tanacetum cinerariifolium]